MPAILAGAAGGIEFTEDRAEGKELGDQGGDLGGLVGHSFQEFGEAGTNGLCRLGG